MKSFRLHLQKDVFEGVRVMQVLMVLKIPDEIVHLVTIKPKTVVANVTWPHIVFSKTAASSLLW